MKIRYYKFKNKLLEDFSKPCINNFSFIKVKIQKKLFSALQSSIYHDYHLKTVHICPSIDKYDVSWSHECVAYLLIFDA